MTKIYISGPMSGLVGYNFSAFDLMAEKLQKKGYEVFNPADVGRKYLKRANNQGTPFDYYGCLREVLHELRSCDAIYLLPGWHHSHGAKKELFVAIKKNLAIILSEEELDEWSCLK